MCIFILFWRCTESFKGVHFYFILQVHGEFEGCASFFFLIGAWRVSKVSIFFFILMVHGEFQGCASFYFILEMHGEFEGCTSLLYFRGARKVSRMCIFFYFIGAQKVPKLHLSDFQFVGGAQ